MNSKRALLSVTDKTGVVDFARGLVAKGYELLSTGGTASALREVNIPVTDISAVTGQPEMLGGRVKTLHPKVHGGILGNPNDPDHAAQMDTHAIEPIEIVAVNLYAFEKTVSSPHTFAEAVESIDIGGPAMIRAAAKNSANVFVIVDPNDYPLVLDALGGPDLHELRRKLMAKAFRHTAYYDSLISRYLSGDEAAETLTVGLRRAQTLRYGENPHQHAALYQDPLVPGGVAHGHLHAGKELSYNNLLDADAAWELVCDLPEGACAIIKHGNPCGAAVGSSLGDSYRQARASDPISAFGGIAAFHGPITAEAAEAMIEPNNFLEVVIGTEFSPEALALFAGRSGWGQSVRLLECSLSSDAARATLRTIHGGVLVQGADEDPGEMDWRVVTRRTPTAEEWAAMRLMWAVVPHVKSNAIVVGTGSRLLGTGAGQMNRVQSVRLALDQAGDAARGAALASDAFFPFADSIETAAAAGIRAVIQPGGSKKDADSIAACDAHDMVMVCTGTRHFRH